LPSVLVIDTVVVATAASTAIFIGMDFAAPVFITALLIGMGFAAPVFIAVLLAATVFKFTTTAGASNVTLPRAFMAQLER
jgi:hypothetical protein